MSIKNSSFQGIDIQMSKKKFTTLMKYFLRKTFFSLLENQN